VRLVLDAGALLALERGDRAAWTEVKAWHEEGLVPVTNATILGQAWRGGGPRQARLARALPGIDVQPVDEPLGRAAGELLARSGTRDIADATLVALTRKGDRVLTSDPDDIATLARHSGHAITIVAV